MFLSKGFIEPPHFYLSEGRASEELLIDVEIPALW